jgi:hypothetical protein
VAAITVWLFNAVPQTVADGAAFATYWVDRKACLGSFTMPALAQSGSSDYALSQEFFDQYNVYSCATNDSNLYAELVTGTGFTPAANQVFRLELGLHQNEYV